MEQTKDEVKVAGITNDVLTAIFSKMLDGVLNQLNEAPNVWVRYDLKLKAETIREVYTMLNKAIEKRD